MKFFRGSLESIADVEIFPIISLLLFVTFFVGLLVYVFTKKKGAYDEVSHIPLEEEEDEIENH